VPQPYPIERPGASAADADRVLQRLQASRRPLLIAGARLRNPAGTAALKDFAESHHVPVAVTWKNQDLFDNASNLYAGHLGFGNPKDHRDLLAQADLVIACGTRLGDVASQNYTFPKVPEPAQPLVHIYPDATPMGAVFRTELGIIADPALLLQELARQPSTADAARRAWAASIKDFIDRYMEFRSPRPNDGIDFGEVVLAISRHAPEDAIVITDAGNFSSWIHRHWRLSPSNLMLGAIGGAMGFGVPAAVAAGIVEPHRTPIVVVGDGGMLMTGQEIATAVATGSKPKVFISNNGIYGTIRAHQEKYFPGRVSATDLTNPDFTLWARSFGVETVTIMPGDDIDAKVKHALDHDGATVVNVHSSREALSAFSTITGLRSGTA
jgi:acetolactate synthase-1/2/3 large subunit